MRPNDSQVRFFWAVCVTLGSSLAAPSVALGEPAGSDSVISVSVGDLRSTKVEPGKTREIEIALRY